MGQKRLQTALKLPTNPVSHDGTLVYLLADDDGNPYRLRRS